MRLVRCCWLWDPSDSLRRRRFRLGRGFELYVHLHCLKEVCVKYRVSWVLVEVANLERGSYLEPAEVGLVVGASLEQGPLLE